MMTDYLETAVLNALRGTSLRVGALYLGLFLSPPTDATPGREPDDPQYARQPITLAAPKQVGDIATAATDRAYTFPAAFVNWGPVTHFGLFDAATGGNLLLYGELDQPLTIHKWEAPSIETGGLKVTAR